MVENTLSDMLFHIENEGKLPDFQNWGNSSLYTFERHCIGKLMNCKSRLYESLILWMQASSDQDLQTKMQITLEIIEGKKILKTINIEDNVTV